MKSQTLMLAVAVAAAGPAFAQKGPVIGPATPNAPQQPGVVTPAPDRITPAGAAHSPGTTTPETRATDNELEICIRETGYRLGDSGTVAVGLGYTLQGHYLRYAIGADGMRMRQTHPGLAPVYPPGRGFDGGEEIDVARLIERAAAGNWLVRATYEAIGTQEYRILSVTARPEPHARCN